MAEALIAGHCPRCAAPVLAGALGTGEVVLLDPQMPTYVVAEGQMHLITSEARAVHRCVPRFTMG